LAAVKAEGFDEFVAFIDEEYVAISLSKSFWLLFAFTDDVDLSARVAKKGMRGFCKMDLHRQRHGVPPRSEILRAYNFFFQLELGWGWYEYYWTGYSVSDRFISRFVDG
jgi:hypothetical protein